MRLSFMSAFKRRLSLVPLVGAVVCAPVSALHFDPETLHFTTLDDLYSTGKELKIWSDTPIVILAISFKYRTNVSWEYTANQRNPCTLSVGDTLACKIYASYIQSAENSLVDSCVIVTNPWVYDYVQLHMSAFPHELITTNSITGPFSDTAGKCIRFSRDSVYCTLRHATKYSYGWDDGFWSPWMYARAAVHCWSIPGRYNVCVEARCQGNLSTGCLQSFPITIVNAGVQASVGAYKSGFYAREVGYRDQPGIDFSQGVNSSQDGDVIFNYGRSYMFSAPYGILSLGIFDSLPIVYVGKHLGFVPDTDAVCKTYKSIIDSIVASLHIVCPAAMAETSSFMNNRQVCLLKTKEGHCAIVAKVGDFVGSHYGELYYWGYQSDGGRMFSPGLVSGLNGTSHGTKRGTESDIKIVKHGHSVRVAFPRDGSIKAISVYKCDGSLLYHHAVAVAKTSSIEFGRLPKGMYIVCVQTGKKRMYQKLFDF